ncbi:hypothetical protein BJ508DRAFT_357082 [Ascobolus immersus RN42]|uniref:LysM domain-containing protein n=1 Tax=Ascobolus immersus RN42 TaxID=1160509 RepID=A0A3N4IT52_ASCIM|nr:hypothetical protein BJ508DRAFT_357082 [Ascobolus immersus RN42]
MNSGLGALSSSSSRFHHSASTSTTTTTSNNNTTHLHPASSSSNLRSRNTRQTNGTSPTPSSSRPASIRSNVSRNSHHRGEGGSATSTTPSRPASMKRSSSQRQNLLIPEGWEGGWSKLSNIANTVLNVDILAIGTGENPWRSEVEGRGGGGGGKDADGSTGRSGKLKAGETNGSGRGEVYSRTKRRSSDEFTTTEDNPNERWNLNAGGSTKRATSPPPSRATSDASHDRLVYIHRVRPTDTFEGLLITFSISATALRRANRLWPGDSIQARRDLLLPVDECYVRGTHLTPDEAAPLLPPDPSDTSTSSTSTPTPSVSGSFPSEYPEPHAYISLPTIPHPIPITRLSPAHLSHFPPHRPPHARTSSSFSTSSLTTPPDTPTGLLPGNLVPGSFPLHAPTPKATDPVLPKIHFPDLHQAEEGVGKVLVMAEQVGRRVEGLWRSLSSGAGEDVSRRGIELGSMRGGGYGGGRSNQGSESGGGGVSSTRSRDGEGRRRRRVEREGKRVE